MIKIFIPFLFGITFLFAGELQWQQDYKSALQEAKKLDKPLYILITSKHCGWCKKFEHTTLQNKQIQQRLGREFVVVKLVREEDVVPQKFATSPIPRHYFVDKNGTILYESLGHRKEECFNAFMDNAQEKLEMDRQ